TVSCLISSTFGCRAGRHATANAAISAIAATTIANDPTLYGGRRRASEADITMHASIEDERNAPAARGNRRLWRDRAVSPALPRRVGRFDRRCRDASADAARTLAVRLPGSHAAERRRDHDRGSQPPARPAVPPSDRGWDSGARGEAALHHRR